MARTRARLIFGLMALLVVGFSPCGAQDADSPSHGQAPLHPETCGNFASLAPNLNSALQSDKLSGLRQLVEQLSQQPSEGGAAPISQVLEALFVSLNEFAQDPPEAGNTDGLCNEVNPPPLNQTNRLCDLRRILKIYIHEAQASRSLHAFGPLIASVLDYIIGNPPASDVPHYEIARNLEVMCTQTGKCDAHDTFDLVQGVTAYLTPARGQRLLSDTQLLIDDPLLTGPGGLLASIGGTSDGGAANESQAEAGFELLGNELLCAISEIDPNASADAGGPFGPIDNLLNGTPYPLIDQNYPPQDFDLPDAGIFHSDLHAELAAATADLKDMLDPDAQEPILQPLQATMACASVSGNSLCGTVLRPGFIPMIYHLGFEAKVVGLDEILGALNELVQIDAQSEEPGMVMKILHDIASSLNRDDEALGALTNLCHLAFQTERPCDDGQGSDCPALPLQYPPGAHVPLQQGCVNAAGVSYTVPSAGCLCTAEAVTPEMATLFNQGITGEIFCVLDTLVYGCTGGTQPACEASSGP